MHDFFLKNQLKKTKIIKEDSGQMSLASSVKRFGV
jgi:hypothetical protein